MGNKYLPDRNAKTWALSGTPVANREAEQEYQDARDLGYSDLYLRNKKDAEEYRRMQAQHMIDSLIEIRTGADGSPEYWWAGTKQPLTAAEVADYEAGQTLN